jgi:hypothetical protein
MIRYSGNREAIISYNLTTVKAVQELFQGLGRRRVAVHLNLADWLKGSRRFWRPFS